MHLLRGPSDSKLGRRAQRVCGPPAPCHGHWALGEGQRHSPRPEPSLLLPKQQVEAPTAREACRGPRRGLDSALGAGGGRFSHSACPLLEWLTLLAVAAEGAPRALPSRSGARQGARRPPPHTSAGHTRCLCGPRQPHQGSCRGVPIGARPAVSPRTCGLSHRKRCAGVILLNSSLSLTLVPPTAAPFSNVFHSYLPRKQEKYYL